MVEKPSDSGFLVHAVTANVISTAYQSLSSMVSMQINHDLHLIRYTKAECRSTVRWELKKQSMQEIECIL
jgi:hypothetical protein